ncbi:MAG TPA: acyl-CoA desaturase [Rhodopirellula sp.]|nr:acyl-CoA desaturase [Rhodopirellula sp.]
MPAELKPHPINTSYYAHHWMRIGLHLASLAWLLMMGFHWAGLLILVVNYVVGALAITVGFHRYFSHKSFKTNRVFQFVLGFLGCCQLQGGPIAWGAIHRHHHRSSDETHDLHSPMHGFYESHYGWLLNPKTYEVAFGKGLSDLNKFKELVWLDRYNFVPPLIYFFALWCGGQWYSAGHPGTPIDGWFVLFWGGILRVVLLWHVTWSVNSVCHIWGKRSFATCDQSRNNWCVAILSLGEGWHNNHHRYPSSARNGFGWMQPDASYYFILLLKQCGIVKDVRD